MLGGWRRQCPQALVECALGRLDAARGPLRVFRHPLGEFGIADVVAANLPRCPLQRLDGRHEVGAHLRRVDVVVGQGHMLDGGQETRLAGQTFRHVVYGVNAADGVQRSAVVLGR